MYFKLGFTELSECRSTVKGIRIFSHDRPTIKESPVIQRLASPVCCTFKNVENLKQCVQCSSNVKTNRYQSTMFS